MPANYIPNANFYAQVDQRVATAREGRVELNPEAVDRSVPCTSVVAP